MLLWTDHPDADTLELYALGRLTEEPNLASVEEHLLVCQDCQREVTLTREVEAVLRVASQGTRTPPPAHY